MYQTITVTLRPSAADSPLLDAGQCFRLQVKPWRKRSLSQNALSHMWYTEISEYLIARGKTFATPEWVKDAMKHTYLGYESRNRYVVSGEVTTVQSSAIRPSWKPMKCTSSCAKSKPGR
jgi:hypothetical protein